MSEVVRVKPNTDKMLDELALKRKESHAFIKSKQDIVAEAVMALHKKEMKQA